MPKYEPQDQTLLMIDKIYDNDYQVILSEQKMNELSNIHSFEKAIIDRIYHLGYKGNKDDIEGIVNYIVQKCREHKINLSKETISNWFDDINPNIPEQKKHGPPIDSEQSRPNVYKLCFALEMNADEVEEFFLKNYMCMPFNYKNTYEVVYYFCFNTNRNYETAVELLKKVENTKIENANSRNETRFGETKALGSALFKIKTEKDFMNHISLYRFNKKDQFYTATRMILGVQYEDGSINEKGILSKCKAVAEIENKLRGFDKKTFQGIDPLLNVIYGYDKRMLDKEKKPGLSKESAFPKLVKKNFPHRQHFTQIEKKTATADIYKKVLIILYFYEFYGNLTNNYLSKGTESTMDLRLYADDFEMYLDTILDQCGFVQLYYRNPFDWLIMYCVGSPNPLKTFRNLIKKYYLDVIGEESYYDSDGVYD